jgi:predicted  nucleic acid-binding Zn-ribbon protein
MSRDLRTRSGSFELVFDGTKFAVPKPSLFYLFEHHTDLMAATSYVVQSVVPLEIFEIFVNSLKAGTKVPVTMQNAGALVLLAKEFCFEELLSECSAVASVAPPELITTLSERISQLEDRLSVQNQSVITELKESVANHDRRLEELLSAIETNARSVQTEFGGVKHSVHHLLTEFEEVKSKCGDQHRSVVSRLGALETTTSAFQSQFDDVKQFVQRLHPELEEVKSKCGDQHRSVVSRIGTLESSTSTFQTEFADVKRSVDVLRTDLLKCETEFEPLVARVVELEHNVSLVGGEFDRKIADALSHVTVRVSVCDQETSEMKSTRSPLKEVECPLTKAGSLNGIISYLTRKHGGNVHTNGIVTITSKSVNPDSPVQNLVDLYRVSGRKLAWGHVVEISKK